MADKNLLDAIAAGVVVFDGAMGTTLQRMQLAGDLTVKDFDGRQGCNEVLSLTRRRQALAARQRSSALMMSCSSARNGSARALSYSVSASSM